MYNKSYLFDEAVMPVFSEAEAVAFVLHEHRRDPLMRGSLVVKTVRGRQYWYVQRKEGRKYSYTYLGPAGRRDVEEKVKRLREARDAAKIESRREKEFTALLRRLGVVPVSGLAEEVLYRLSRAEVIYGKGMVFGTVAFLAYQIMLGFSALRRAGRTADIDLVRPEILSLTGDALSLADALEDLWVEFVPEAPPEETVPYRLAHPSGLKIEVFIAPKGPPGKIIPPPHSGYKETGSLELAYLGYLTENPVSTCLLGSRHLIPVTVPAPERFVWHKLLTATRRREMEKQQKDVTQALVIAHALKVRGGSIRLREAFEEIVSIQSKKRRKAFIEFVKKKCSSETPFPAELFDDTQRAEESDHATDPAEGHDLQR